MLLLLPTVGTRDQSLLRDSRCRRGAKAAQQLADAIPTSREKVNARRVAIARLTSAPFPPGQITRRGVSKHQRNKLAAAGDFKLAEDAVNMLFHRR